MSRPTRLLVSCLVLVSLLAVPGVATAAGAPATDAATANATQSDAVAQTFTASLTPDDPGTIRVELAYEIPDDVTTLSTRLPEGVRVQSTNGFQRRSGTTYDWTRTTDTPSITYAIDVNQTISRGTEGEQTGGYLYVDAGEWAIARAPRAGVTYSGTGAQPDLVTDYAFTGDGATSGDILYLGRFEEHRRSAAGQTIRLVVPAEASLQSSPDAVLDTLASAAESLSMGPTDPEVVAIAAPTTVEWGSTGLQRGESDFWVLDDQRVDSPSNVWIHEYVHTRQVYRPTDATRWSVEGMADYYAAFLTYQQDRISYDRYRRHLETAEKHQDAVLAEPETWEGTFANYDKGALVFAALDRQMRLDSDGEATLQGAIRRFNDGTVEQDEFLSAVEAASGSDPRAFARRYTETDAVPETWSQQEQRQAFGGPQPAFVYEFVPPYERSGPYRSDTVGATPTVVLGESLSLRVAVENTGSEPGDYTAVLRTNGERVATRNGQLAPGAREVLTFDRSFDTRGSVRFTVESASETVTVREPATPRVTGIDTPRRVAPGESVTLTATVGNPAGRPANGTVTLAVDGDPLATKQVRLEPNETTTVTATASFRDGEHRVTAGSRERTIRVVETTPTTPTRSESVTRTAAVSATGTVRSPDGARARQTPTGGGGPGVGALGALVALLAVGGLASRR
ncbi:PGF-CTERM sorting domain-containing protein [Halorarius litoreus]|uniref:PGF-CTERM sorting domain-containing protein n=1 Tax=Halorarius litoreus TaxID=2962676 RepID=UPI0020CD210E|nr:PGF-CTERM sorting domain-containing protein [Halorarius litoreus]